MEGLLRMSLGRVFASVVVVGVRGGGWKERGGSVCLRRVGRSWIWSMSVSDWVFGYWVLLNGVGVYLSILYIISMLCHKSDASKLSKKHFIQC